MCRRDATHAATSERARGESAVMAQEHRDGKMGKSLYFLILFRPQTPAKNIYLIINHIANTRFYSWNFSNIIIILNKENESFYSCLLVAVSTKSDKRAFSPNDVFTRCNAMCAKTSGPVKSVD